MKYSAKLLLLVMALTLASFGQTALNQTTITSVVNANNTYSGTSQTTDNSITVASTTGFTASSNNNGVLSIAYIDQEAMAVKTVNTTTKVVTVIRGYMGTKAMPHSVNSMVLVGPTAAFITQDLNGKCTTAATQYAPMINVLNGNQWLCSTVTTQWVPGFQNTSAEPGVTLLVASVAGATTISGPLFHINGTNAITSWTIPVGMNATAHGATHFCVIPDAAFTTTATNNIAIASTAVANKLICWTWDATNSKFVASY